MGLPTPDSLSLFQAKTFIAKRCACSSHDAEEALLQGGRDGYLDATGSIPLSAHPDPKKREAHGPRRRERLLRGDWESDVDWDTGRVGPYSSVTITRLSIENWLQRPELANGDDVKSTPSKIEKPLENGAGVIVSVLGQKKRGRPPEKLESTMAAMREKLRDKSLTIDQLANMFEKNLVKMFGVSRTTCRDAKKAVLSESEFVGNSIPDK